MNLFCWFFWNFRLKEFFVDKVNLLSICYSCKNNFASKSIFCNRFNVSLKSCFIFEYLKIKKKSISSDSYSTNSNVINNFRTAFYLKLVLDLYSLIMSIFIELIFLIFRLYIILIWLSIVLSLLKYQTFEKIDEKYSILSCEKVDLSKIVEKWTTSFKIIFD